ncbi:MAG: ABC transporter permease [Thermoleophilia bacterium]|nr:ABC transporter permease [Thermoleophilia bacterium]
MNAVAAIVRANLRRTVNDRSNIFFLIVLPLLIVFALGSAIGGSANDLVVGVVDPNPTPLSQSVRAAMVDSGDVTVSKVTDADTLRHDVATGRYNAGWIVDASTTPTTIVWIAGLEGPAIAMRAAMERAVAATAADAQVVSAVVRSAKVSPERAASIVDTLQGVPTVPVTASSTTVDAADDPATIRAVLAGGELTLFIFLTSLFGAQALLTSRQHGVTRRTRAAPVTSGQIVAGEAISRYLVAMIQAAIIIVGTIALFQVDWGSPVAVIVLSAAMALVGTGAAMLLGALGRSEQQVGALALMLGLVLAALGGSMQPLEFFPEGMRKVAFAITPHAWMNDSLWKILVDGAGLRSVIGAVGVLAAAGLVLLAVASRVLMRRMV